MKKPLSIGSALGLALCSVVLASCSQGGNSSGQGGSAAEQPGQISLDSKAEAQIREAIANAPANGLKPDLFLKGSEKGAALIDAALKYASALANGYSDPTRLHEVYTIPHANVDVRQGLQQAIQEGDVKDWLDSLTPQTDEYRALSQAHVHFLQLAAASQFQPVAAGKPIKPGSHDPRAAQVRAALKAVGYLSAPPPQQPGTSHPQHANSRRSAPQSTIYSGELVAAVKRLQGEFGFKQDGAIGGNTLDALNAGPAYRARELAIAMERLRWLPRNPPSTRIDVNTAASFLDYWRDGQHVDHRKVINGEADKPTPQLQAPIVRLVAKPTWTVPKGIGEKELADKSQSWLNENKFVLKDGQYVQLSGPKNSLGLVKFDMQDKEAIYLHDTPAKALFALPDRHRSHGCVRVQNAVQFATALAQQEGVLDQFQKAMRKDDESFVKLPSEIPVRLLYQTAFWDGSRVQFRPDLYGWDENVAKALELAPGPPQKIQQPESSQDIGP
ncbi:MAG TPA: L,D-transpeptidase family protein [Sphingomicrobium sp.]|nr:L,D-transpeptidase family protein [Sphingomicrobium sp.]